MSLNEPSSDIVAVRMSFDNLWSPNVCAAVGELSYRFDIS